MRWEDEYRMYYQEEQGDEGSEPTDSAGRFRLSISSESDVGGVEISSPNQPHDFGSGREGQEEIWAYADIEAGLKELPGGDRVAELLGCSVVPAGDILQDTGPDQRDTVVLLAVWYIKQFKPAKTCH